MKHKITTLFLILLSLCEATAQGLDFRSMNYTIDERTSYEVFTGQAPRFDGRLEISFEMLTYPTSRYGYVFRLENMDEKGRIWNLSYDGRWEQIVIRLNDEGHRSAIFTELNRKVWSAYKWHKVRVKFDAVADSIYFSIDSLSYSQPVHFSSSTFHPKLSFGISGHVVELPSFSMRNLEVSDGNRTIRFPLDESSGNKVHDERGVARGKVVNPTWLIHDATHWKKITTLETGGRAGVYYDTQKHQAIMYDNAGLTIYDLGSERSSQIEYLSPIPVNILSGTSFLKDGYLYVYELSEWEHPLGAPSVARLDLETMQWEVISCERLDGPMHHHASFINSVTGKETFFGGYGNMYFNGEFYTLEQDGSWQKHPVEEDGDALLFPRFFCSAGTSADSLGAYIFGGMGNETGEEVVGRRYFYDLHRYDFVTGETKFLWTADLGEESCVPARGLVVQDDCFYALCYPEYLTIAPMYLYRFNLSDGSHTRLGAPIEVNSDKVWCYNQLYYDAGIGRLVALCINKDKQLRPTVDVYTMMFPPVESASSGGHFPLVAIFLLAVLGLAASLFVLFRLLKARRNRRKESDNYVLSRKDPAKRIYVAPSGPDSIHLFGDFTVTGHDGDNITGEFTQQVRTLLLLLVKYSETGVSPSRISGILWPDKEPEKARNSRGVAMSNLRKAIEPIKGLSLSYGDNLYRLECSDGFHLDYRDFISSISSGDTDRALAIVSRGRFLKDIRDSEFDSFKSESEGAILPFISQQLKEKFAQGRYRATIEIADMAFEYDLQDDLAMKLSVKSLLALGRRDDALVRYSIFQANYRKLSGEPYPVKFENL
ncbi:MAG: hypothetical protein II143_00625 [Bacteroidales bacterium]|nr:hypothetical protein [Bacteroidales bacterium]